MTAEFFNKLVALCKTAPPFEGTTPTVAGPWLGPVPQGTVFPQCTFHMVGPSRNEWFTNVTYLERSRLQFSFWHTDDGAALGYAAQLQSVLKGAKLSLSAPTANLGLLLIQGPYEVPVSGMIKTTSSQPVYHIAMDYRVWNEG